ncbi:MAG: LysR family transcriptional regulator [Gammaproteobacteria bacterium]|nr:LysR family transcriptional regulator [Gammaproteobacteria bacterium]MBU1416388.1 LysR family transcriptional regulator [Gammaproteobacteria bacterium]
MDQLESMRLFVRVSELGSFAAVAHQLGVARSVVTRKVAGLEAKLGVKLIARSTRRLNLTSAGAAYLEKCREILNLLEIAETDIAEDRQVPRGPIRIGLPLIFGVRYLAPLLLEFCRRHPGVDLDMDFSDRRINLIEEGVDLSIRVTDYLGQREIARRLGTSRMVVVASSDYLAQHGEPKHPADLSAHECLGYTFSDNAAWQFLVDRQLRAFPVRGRIQANNGDVLMEAAVQGQGIAREPIFIAGPVLKSGKVREILAEFPIPELGVYAVLPGNRHIPHRVRTLVDFLAGRLSQDLPWNER